MAKRRGHLFIVFGESHRTQAERLAEEAGKMGLGATLQDFSQTPLWFGREGRTLLKTVDLVVVIWPRGSTKNFWANSHTQKALTDGRLFIVRTDFDSLPLTFDDYRVPRSFLVGNPDSKDFEKTVGDITEEIDRQRSERSHAIVRALRVAVSPVADPTSYWFMKRNWHRIRAGAADALSTFEALAIEPKAKAAVKERVVSAAQEVAAYGLWADSVRSFIQVVALLAFAGILVGGPFAGVYALDLTVASPVVFSVQYVVSVVASVLVLIGPLVVTERLDNELETNGRRVALLWMLALAVSIVVWIVLQEWPPAEASSRHALAGGAATSVLAVASVFALAVFLTLLESLLQRRGRRWLPEATIVTDLMMILKNLPKPGASPFDVQHRRAIMQGLEGLADAAERGLPPRLKTGDYATDVWVGSTAQRIAEGFRALKKLAALPGSPLEDQPRTPWSPRASLEQLREAVRDAFLSSACGDWASLPQAEPTRITRPQRFAQVIRFMRALLAAAVPAVLLAIVDRYVTIPADLRPWVIVGVLVWVSLSMLLAIDPQLATKVSVFKELRSVLNPSSGKDA